MKYKTIFFAILITCFLFFTENLFAQESEPDWKTLVEKTNWKSFSKNLVTAIKSGNTGLQVSAMQLVIKWGDRINVSGAALDLVKLYRKHENEKVRQIALVTINAMNNDWAAGIAIRDLAFEDSERMKRMMVAIIRQNQTRNNGPG